MDYISTLISQPGSPAFTESLGSDIKPNYKGKFKIHIRYIFVTWSKSQINNYES